MLQCIISWVVTLGTYRSFSHLEVCLEYFAYHTVHFSRVSWHMSSSGVANLFLVQIEILYSCWLSLSPLGSLCSASEILLGLHAVWLDLSCSFVNFLLSSFVLATFLAKIENSKEQRNQFVALQQLKQTRVFYIWSVEAKLTFMLMASFKKRQDILLSGFLALNSCCIITFGLYFEKACFNCASVFYFARKFV